MEKPTRRSVLAGLLSVPVLGKALLAFASPGTPSEDGSQEDPRRLRAIQVLRFMNTAQAWHRNRVGRYATMDELRKSEAVDALRASSAATKKGIGEEFFATLRFSTSEIIPGWQFTLKVGEQGRAYTMTLEDTSEDALGAFSSDQRGRIYQGESLAPSTAAHTAPAWADAQASLVRPQGIGAKQYAAEGTGRIRTFLKTVALGSPQGQGYCCYGFCLCQNCSTYWWGGCINAGCDNCIWCCPTSQ